MVWRPETLSLGLARRYGRSSAFAVVSRTPQGTWPPSAMSDYLG
jgi:hypothetical protein